MAKRNLLVFIALIGLFILTQDAFAGAGGTGMGMGMGGPPCGVGNFPPCPPAAPIDGGILLLAGAGIAMGANKMLRKKV